MTGSFSIILSAFLLAVPIIILPYLIRLFTRLVVALERLNTTQSRLLDLHLAHQAPPQS
jgi:hypothetical protein